MRIMVFHYCLFLNKNAVHFYTLTVFIKEILDDELFYKYEW
jgi:hypothetical protein